MTSSTFIGKTRGQLIDRLASLRDVRDDVYLVSVDGIEGMGKTSLIRELALRLSQRDEPGRYRDLRTVVVHLKEMGQFVPPASAGDPLLANFERYQALLSALVHALPPPRPVGFTSVLKYQDKLLGHARTQGLEVAVHDARREVERAFDVALLPFGLPRRKILLLDEFDKLVGYPIGEWLLELARRLRGALVVVTGSSFGGPPGQTVTVHRLDNFTVSEVGEYLAEVMKNVPLPDGVPEDVPLPDGVPEAVHRFSGGHPGAVALSGDWVAERLKNGKEVSASIFRGLTRNLPKDVSSLVDRIIADMRDEDLRTALENAWVLRRFDAEALFYVSDQQALEMSDDEAKRYGLLLKRLREYSFVTEIERESPGEPDGHTFYTFHEFLRSVRDAELAELPIYQNLHERAAKYYEVLMDRWEDEFHPETAYKGWYRYEHPEWQMLKVEWFYHVRHMTRNRGPARLAFVGMFLDAFWWWGMYRHFKFCDELLDEWEFNAVESDAPWTRALREFYQSYPPRWPWVHEPRRDWRKVERSMEDIRDLCGLERKPVSDMEDRRERKVRGQTCVFLAHAAGRLAPESPDAGDWFAEALKCFEADEDMVSLSWTTYEQGDLYERVERHGESLDLCRRALELATSAELDDHELAANACRCMGDARLALGELEEGFQLHADALFHAYRFQVDPHPPDDYTRDFYREIVELATGQLLRVWRDVDRGSALTACERVRASFAPYWGADEEAPDFADLLSTGDRDRLALALAPPAPDDDDLGELTSTYYERARDATRAMRRRRRATASGT